LRFIKKKLPQENVIIEEEDEDDMENLCAICHMQIVKSDPTTLCTNVCRNTFHLDCFSQWMKYELKNNGIVKCPLCRDVKSEEDLRIIKVKEYEIKESINSKKVGVCYNYYCDGCMLK
jgi:hypothetical protein